MNPGRLGQFPTSLGSPPMRTHCEWDGVGPSRMKSRCQPGGDTPALGGAVIVQVVPSQVKAGKIVLAPIVFPCVLDVAATSDTRIVEAVPWCKATFVIT